MEDNIYLDERQIAISNKISKQSFFILIALVFIESILRENGIIFADPQNSGALLIFLSISYWSIKSAVCGVFAKNYKSSIKIIFPLFAVGMALMIYNAVRKGDFHLVYQNKLTSIPILLFGYMNYFITSIITIIKDKKE